MVIELVALAGALHGTQAAPRSADLFGYSVVTTEVVGEGGIEVSPSQRVYARGAKVQVKAVPRAGHVFAGWINGCGALQQTDSVKLDSSVVLVALFKDAAERLPNGGFELGWKFWHRWNDPLLAPVWALRDGQGCVAPGAKGKVPTSLQLYHPIPAIQAGEAYRLYFKARAGAPRNLSVVLRDHGSPWTHRTAMHTVALDTSERWHSVLLQVQTTSANPRIGFDLGADAAEICLDSVSLSRDNSGFAPRGMQGIEVERDRAGSVLLRGAAGADWGIRDAKGRSLRTGRFDGTGRFLVRGLPSGTLLVTVVQPEGLRVARLHVW